MAQFEPRLDAIDSLSMDLQKLGRLEPNHIWRILTPAANLLKRLFREKILTTFQQHSGILARSIEIFPKQGDEPYILVYPSGPHHRYKARVKETIHRKTGKLYKSGGRMKTATAAEVAFVLEYGDTHHKATHWMERTFEEHSAEIAQALQEGFDAFMDEWEAGR